MTSKKPAIVPDKKIHTLRCYIDDITLNYLDEICLFYHETRSAVVRKMIELSIRNIINDEEYISEVLCNYEDNESPKEFMIFVRMNDETYNGLKWLSEITKLAMSEIVRNFITEYSMNEADNVLQDFPGLGIQHDEMMQNTTLMKIDIPTDYVHYLEIIGKKYNKTAYEVARQLFYKAFLSELEDSNNDLFDEK